ncbi:MAG: type 4a pilus biogenesis protein PilO [Fusobacteriota bacterium]
MEKISREQGEKIALIVILILVSLVILNNLVLKDMDLELENGKKELQNIRLKYAQELEKVSVIEEKKESIEKKEIKYNDLRRKFVFKKEQKNLIRSITNISQKWDIQVEKLVLDESSRDGKPIFQLNISLKSKYKNLFRYLYAIQRLDKKLFINKASFAKSENNVRVNLEIFTYIINEVDNHE